MLPYDKYWLHHEMQAIQAQMKIDKLNKKDTAIMFQMIFCLFVLLFSVVDAQDIYLVCPTCLDIVHLRVIQDDRDYDLEVKSGQWKCPKCDYVNDNRIRYCGLCGAERQ